MDDSQIVDLEEFRQLRAEINNRTTLGNQLFSYAAAALGAGLAVFDKFPDVLLGLAVVTSWFWLLWVDHTGQVFKIAPYIALKLAPRLRFGQMDTLGWEQFVRKLDAEGLVKQDGKKKLSIPRTGATIGYAAILFGGSAPILMTIYWFLQMHGAALNTTYYVRIFAMVCVSCIWIFAVNRARMMAAMTKRINAAILAAEVKS